MQWGTLVTQRGITPTASNSKWTVPAGGDGVWEAVASVAFDSDADGRRVVELHINGSPTFSDSRTPIGAASPTKINLSGTWDLVAGDTIEVVAYHNAGNDLAITDGSYVTVRRKC